MSNNNPGGIRLITTNDMAVIEEEMFPQQNGILIFEDDGGGFSDDDNSTKRDNGQYLSYSERLEELKRRVEEVNMTEVKIEYSQREKKSRLCTMDIDR